MSDSLTHQLISDLQSAVRRLDERVRVLENEKRERAQIVIPPEVTPPDYWKNR